MSAPARQAPMIHVVQLVRSSRLCSGCCEATGTSGHLSACSCSFDSASFGGMLASPAGRGQPNYGVIPWLPENFGLSVGSAGTPSCYFLWVFCSLVYSRLQNWIRGCWVHHSFHLSRHLLVLHHRLMALWSKLAVLHCCLCSG